MKEIQKPVVFSLITENAQLVEVCEQARQQQVVALDTEFVRTRSYFPKLGLIQLYDGQCVSLIDLLTISDFAPFVELLADANVLKVLHACSEDLEVFQHAFGQLPQPMRDTQVMAAFLGFSQSTGLATLAKHYFQLELDKNSARTDWIARPLSDKQLRYAADDVCYLLPLYQRLNDALNQTNWQQAVAFDCALFEEKRQRLKPADKAYRQIGNAWRLEQRELARLQLLAKWRQEEAIKRDLALNFVVRAENLWAIAKYNPKHTSQLIELGLSTQEVRIHGKKLLQLVEQANRLPEADCPPKIEQLNTDPRYKQTLKALKNRLESLCPADLKPELIASRRDLDRFIRWVWIKQCDPNSLPSLMRGWREKFGQELLTILQ